MIICAYIYIYVLIHIYIYKNTYMRARTLFLNPDGWNLALQNKERTVDASIEMLSC